MPSLTLRALPGQPFGTLRTLLLVLLLGLASAVWAQDAATPSISKAQEARANKALGTASALLQTRKTGEAIEHCEQVIADYKATFGDENTRYFAARRSEEAVLYLLQAAAGVEKKAAVMVSYNWALAYYCKGYAFVELRQWSDAQMSLEQAITMSPQNSKFLSELAHTYQEQKNWDKALETFRAAEAAKDYSPDNLKISEWSRAKRGMAFALVEMNRLDEAEKLHRECLELDPNDRIAAHEIRYIQMLRAKQKAI